MVPLTVRADSAKLTKTNVLLIGTASILTGLVANLLYFFILKKHESYVVSALIYAAPAFTLLLAYFILREKVTGIGCLGVAFVVVGTVCIALNDNKTINEMFVIRFD